MPFLAPFALISLLIAGPIIIAMYLLKLKRQEQQVSSTFLWKQAIRDVEANAPWQRLRFSWLLLLQLLLLALLAFALARPFFQTTGIAGRNLIVIIDRSASMAAVDNGTSRLAAAKAQAVALLEQLPDEGRATIIAAGGTMEVPASSSNDRRQLRQAIDSIQLSLGGGSDMASALALASALSARESESEVAIISDGNITVPPDLKVPAIVRFFPIGTSKANLAISATALQPNAVGQSFFAQVSNYGDQPATRRVDVYLDGRIVNAYNLELAAGASKAITLDVPATVQVAEARLSADAAQDALALDDSGWAVSVAGQQARVRVIGPGNRFLETALSLLPGLQLQTLPAATTTFTETIAEVPVTVLDGVIPPTLPPGNLLFIAPPRSTEYFSVTGEIDRPLPRPMPGDDLLLRNVSIADTNIFKAVRIAPGAWARVVIDSDGGPLLMAGERDGRRIVILSFALQKSDLPLTLAFPLLSSNIISYLAPGLSADTAQIAPDQALVVPVDARISSVRMTKPDGTARILEVVAGQAVATDTNQQGPYTIELFEGERLAARRRYAVNLFSEQESRITPSENINVAQVSGLAQAVVREQVGKQEIWRWLAIAALVLLMVEWFVSQRGSWTRLWSLLRGRVMRDA